MMRRINIIFFALLFMATACREQEPAVYTEAAIINDVFMEAVGTEGYRYHTLRPAPNGDVYSGGDTLNVAITPYLSNMRQWEPYILASAKKRANAEDARRINALLQKMKSDPGQLSLPIERLTNTGRYRLFPYIQRTVSIDTLSAIGKVEFTRTYSDGQYAIVVATIRDQYKGGIVKFYLLEKKTNVWRKKEAYELEVY